MCDNYIKLINWMKIKFSYEGVRGTTVFKIDDGYLRFSEIKSEILMEYAETEDDVDNNCFEDSEWYSANMPFDVLIEDILRNL